MLCVHYSTRSKVSDLRDPVLFQGESETIENKYTDSPTNGSHKLGLAAILGSSARAPGILIFTEETPQNQGMSLLWLKTSPYPQKHTGTCIKGRSKKRVNKILKTSPDDVTSQYGFCMCYDWRM